MTKVRQKNIITRKYKHTPRTSTYTNRIKTRYYGMFKVELYTIKSNAIVMVTNRQTKRVIYHGELPFHGSYDSVMRKAVKIARHEVDYNSNRHTRLDTKSLNGNDYITTKHVKGKLIRV